MQSRDIKILKEVGRWRVVLSRHIKELAGFEGNRCCYNRLKILVDNNYLKREKVLYGEPYIYSLTNKSRTLLNYNKRQDKIRPQQYRHDVTLLDIVIDLIKEQNLILEMFTSEKELNGLDGFGTRRHNPDFIINHSEQKIAVEIELSIKAFPALEKNVIDNYKIYDKQIWYVPKNESKIIKNITELQRKWQGIEIRYLDEMAVK